MQQAIAYYRVSTARQGRSGLGIEAQRDAVVRFAAAEGYDLADEFVDVETGKGADALDRRPQLAAALAAGRKGKRRIIVAKLDRLSRDVALGNSTNAADAAALGRRTQIVEANAFAANAMSIIEALRVAGVTDLRGLAEALNARGVPTARGGAWHVSNVRNVLRRVQAF